MAVAPEFQGRGLAKPLLRAVLLRLKQLGHDEVVLATQSTRLAAIRLCESFGVVMDTRPAEAAGADAGPTTGNPL